MIYLLDADMNGVSSIRDLIDAGLVQRIKCDSYPAFDTAVRDLVKAVGPKDRVILDTVNTLMHTTIMDAKFGLDVDQNLWDKRGGFLSDPNYLKVYDLATAQITRRLRNLRARECNLTILTHEKDKKDEGSVTMRGMAVNDALYSALKGMSTDILKLHEITADEINMQTGEVRAKAGTRILFLKGGSEYVTKYHVTREKAENMPTKMRVPLKESGMKRLIEVLGQVPECLVLYGPPGVGKTTFAVSEAYENKEQPHTPTKEKK